MSFDITQCHCPTVPKIVPAQLPSGYPRAARRVNRGPDFASGYFCPTLTLGLIIKYIEGLCGVSRSSARPGGAAEMPVCDQAHDFVHHGRPDQGGVPSLIVGRRYLNDVTPN
jgi:hypothetical protein